MRWFMPFGAIDFLPKTAGTAGFRQTLQTGMRILAEDAEKTLDFRILKAGAAFHQRGVLLHHALGAADVGFFAFDFQRLGTQVGGNMEALFEELQIAVVGADERGNSLTYFDTCIHRVRSVRHASISKDTHGTGFGRMPPVGSRGR